MARGDAKDLFFRKLRIAGLSKPAVETLAERLDALEAADSAASSASVALHAFPFTHATPGLEAGVEVYTPAVGTILLDAWLEVDTAWDGTTPLFDVGTFFGGNNFGWFAFVAAPLPMAFADSDGLVDNGSLVSQVDGTVLTDLQVKATQFAPTLRLIPARFALANPVKICVSQTGAVGGAAAGSTVGASTLYLLVGSGAADPNL